MLTLMAIITSVALVAFLAKSALRTSGLSAGAKVARETGDLDRLVAAIDKLPFREQATQWDQAIGDLWRAYARVEAAGLVVEAARRSDADIVQYWIRQIHEVEPEIAAEHFSEEFMEEYFRPEVAAQCGKGCGC